MPIVKPEDNIKIVCLDCEHVGEWQTFNNREKTAKVIYRCPECESRNIFPLWKLIDLYNELKAICSEYM